MRRRFLAILALIAMAAAILPGPLGVAFAQADAEQVNNLTAGALVEVDLDAGEAVYDFVAPSGSVYDVWLFPAAAEAPARPVPTTSGSCFRSTVSIPRPGS